MKRSFLKFTNRKFMSVVLIAASAVVLTPATSQANDNKKAAIEIKSTENTTSVQFAGSTENALLFDVKVNNPKSDRFTLVIQSADGEVLFSQTYNDANFSKKVKLLKGGDDTSYKFSIKSANKSLENSFVVDATIKTFDNVVVTKL